MLLYSTVKAPIASSIFLSILQLPSWVQMLADYPEEAPSPHTLTSHLKALPSDSTHDEIEKLQCKVYLNDSSITFKAALLQDLYPLSQRYQFLDSGDRLNVWD
jgi:hypothetical protein